MDILVSVLDGVVRGMRQQYANRQRALSEGNAAVARLDAQIASVEPKRAQLAAELAEKRERAEQLKAAVKRGEDTMASSVDVAKAALNKATLVSRKNEAADIASLKLSTKGYDGKGRALPGREVNLRKKDGGPAARRPGDMLPGKTDDEALLARVNAVLSIQTPK